MLPFHVTLIPRYIMFYRLGWVDSFLPLTVPSFFAINAFFVFLMVQFMRGIPVELDHAAKVDGCGPIQVYLYIMLPLAMPALVTAAIFTFIWTWNDFFSQLIYLSNPLRYTIALALRAFQDATSSSSFGQLFAMSILSLVPIFIFFVSAQRLLIEGIATTGFKG
jgi:multiple sugar transport system permease protein